MDKRYLWVVEYYQDGHWSPSRIAADRKSARQQQIDLRFFMTPKDKTRVRKYVPAE